MAFVAETKILTSTGWKPIAELGGKDKVLVRNFIGDAEFIQPFALKKKSYTGEVVKFGGKYWNVRVTPDHKIIYDRQPDGTSKSQQVSTAQEIKVDKHKYLYRKFRYIREDRTRELIKLKNGDSYRTVVLSDTDWYTIVAYTVMSGYISKDKNPRLKFMIDGEPQKRLINILDSLGISWNLGFVNDCPVLTVNRDNNLATKLKHKLGSRKRSDMKLPAKMIYGSSQSLMRHFIDTITDLAAKPAMNRPNQLMFTSINVGLLRDLKLICMFCGYGFSMTKTNTSNLAIVIPYQPTPWTVRKVEKQTYSGYVYEIDLFDGLVYTTEGSLPVWMSPK